MLVLIILCLFFSSFGEINRESNGFKVDESIDRNIHIDVDLKRVIEKRSGFLEKLFTLKDCNGKFQASLNNTDLLLLQLRFCKHRHNIHGTITMRKDLCARNPQSYSITCHTNRGTNFEPECSFTFCLDRDYFGQGQVVCGTENQLAQFNHLLHNYVI